MATDEPESASSETESATTNGNGWGFSRFTRRAASVVTMIVFVVITLIIIWQLITLLLVLFLGVLFAIFLRGITNYVVQRTGIPDKWALFSVTALLVVAFGVIGLATAPAVSNQANLIAEKIPEAVDELQRQLEATSAGRRILSELADLDPDQLLRGDFWGPLGGAVFGVAGAISHGAFVLAVGLYLAFDPTVYKRGILRMVPINYRDRTKAIIAVCSHQLGWWLLGRLLAMLGVAVIITIGLSILGIPLPFLLGLIAGLFSFVPILGPIVSVVPAALLALLVGPQFVLWVILLYLGAQAVESYWITPVVQHRFVSLPHAMTLIAEIFAGILFGVIGITIATPLAVLLMALINMLYVEDVLGDTTPFTELAAEYPGLVEEPPDQES